MWEISALQLVVHVIMHAHIQRYNNIILFAATGAIHDVATTVYQITVTTTIVITIAATIAFSLVIMCIKIFKRKQRKKSTVSEVM